jgi:tetratricopeptide (TPR) repeat protein
MSAGVKETSKLKDANYFTEHKMNEMDSKHFVEALPRPLREEFSKYLTEGQVRLQDYVLQGYETKTFYGVKEIRFWYGLTKHLNWFPIAGQVVILINRLLVSSSWRSIYFDETTGDMINSEEAERRRSVNQEAEEHYSKGEKFNKEGKYEEAMNEFDVAYAKSSETYKKKSSFHESRVKAQSKLAESNKTEGVELLNRKEFKSAAKKFQIAMENAQNDTERNKYKAERDHAEAQALSEEGDKLQSRKNYAEAIKKHNAAIDLCPSSYSDSKSEFKNRSAEASYQWSREFDSDGDYDEILQVLSKAKENSSDPILLANIEKLMEQTQMKKDEIKDDETVNY